MPDANTWIDCKIVERQASLARLGSDAHRDHAWEATAVGIVRQSNARVLHPQRGPPWQARSAAALRTATTTRRALVVAAARCRSLNTQTLISQDTASAPRAQTAPTTSPELAWPATQGIMWSRARRLTQTSTPVLLGICTANYPCSDASQYYTTQYDTCYAKTTPGGACSSSQSYRCTSGLCSNDICCDQAAADSGCTSACDPGTGTCSTRVMAGEECSSTADCYNDAACLGGRCCSMSQSQYAER